MSHRTSTRRILTTILCLLPPLVGASDRQDWNLNYNRGQDAFEAGRYDEAVPALTAALGQARAFSPADPRLVKSAYTLALTYYVKGQPALAEPLYLEAKRTAEAIGSDGLPLLGYVLEGLGELRMEQARWKESEQMFNQAIEACSATHAKNHPCTLAAKRHLGELLAMEGRTTEAEDLFQQLLGILRQVPYSPEFLAETLDNLAAVYTAESRFALAESSLRESMEVASQNSITGPVLADTLADLGRLYRLEGNTARAEPLLTKALGIYEAAHDPHQAGTLNELGRIAINDTKFAVAKDYFSRSLNVYNKIDGSAHLFAARVEAGLAEAFLGEHNISKARELIGEALTTERQSLGGGHEEYARLLMVAARVEEAGHRSSEAERYYKQALDIYRQSLADGHPERDRAEQNYARFIKSLRK